MIKFQRNTNSENDVKNMFLDWLRCTDNEHMHESRRG